MADELNGKSSAISDPAPTSAEPAAGSGLKLLLELGSLVLFFIAYSRLDIYWATGTLMVTTVASIIAMRVLTGHVSPMPVVTAVLVLVFGGLTLWLQDPSFIKLKPTLVYLLFASALFVGLVLRRPMLQLLFGQAFRLTEEGWRRLTLRWAVFFLAMAALNEAVWRNMSESAWVAFKAWGFLPLTVSFAVAQVGLIKRYAAPE
jgi:intracellular septation protein